MKSNSISKDNGNKTVNDQCTVHIFCLLSRKQEMKRRTKVNKNFKDFVTSNILYIKYQMSSLNFGTTI